MNDIENPEGDDPVVDETEPAEDVFAGNDDRAKFREALARKAGGKGQGNGETGGGSKVGGSAHGPAKAQRTFRRKSGG